MQLHKKGWSYAKLFFIVQSRMSLGISQIKLPEYVWLVPRFIGIKCKMTRILIFFLSLIIVSDLWFYQSTDKEKSLTKAERFLKDQRTHWPKSHFKYIPTQPRIKTVIIYRNSNENFLKCLKSYTWSSSPDGEIFYRCFYVIWCQWSTYNLWIHRIVTEKDKRNRKGNLETN